MAACIFPSHQKTRTPIPLTHRDNVMASTFDFKFNDENLHANFPRVDALTLSQFKVYRYTNSNQSVIISDDLKKNAHDAEKGTSKNFDMVCWAAAPSITSHITKQNIICALGSNRFSPTTFKQLNIRIISSIPRNDVSITTNLCLPIWN